MTKRVEVRPVTPGRWGDLEKLFGPSGAYGGCWCMYFRMRSAENARAKGSERKAAMKALVESGQPPGLLAYVDDVPAGWVSLDARERFTMLQYSRMYKPVDDAPVWTIVCFVVGKKYRRQGLMAELLNGAARWARENGARALEAYPDEPDGELKGYAGYMGIRPVFDRAGFQEVARLKNGRPVMRKVLG
ncbi:MAG TPA: GNAT family N-acetyltransferase [Dehalococcoidia bacterium]|nr:GNAT family N-acetyltransferase [Dehalococcoidia bacterium]